MQRITEEVRPVYVDSTIYQHTIWKHVLNVSRFAKDFALKIGANPFIAEAGGLLHDLGAAKFGKENHHITGVQEASLVLVKCECPLELVGPILSTIYSHRGSQRIVFQSPEAKCVAAGDAKEHFVNLGELWVVQTKDLGIPEMQVYQVLSDKLERDWLKTSPEIKVLLNGTYENAKQELLQIASRNGTSKKRSKSHV
jgi:putative nucleotidyltransferase with HDIG domain